MQLLDDGSTADARARGIDLADFATSKDCAEALCSAYPGYRWGIRCQWEQGVIDIFCLDVSGEMGFRLHLLGPKASMANFSASAFRAECIRAGGEILERFNMPRQRFNADRYDNAPVDFAGKMIGDRT
jgi:hypothetical protein